MVWGEVRLKFLRLLVAACGLLTTSTAVNAQADEWFVGSHPDYHAAMVRDIDGIFVAIYVATEPSMYGSPLLMETNAPTCDTKMPISLHATEAIMAFGQTAEDRLIEVRSVVQAFYDQNVRECAATTDLEARFFHRFDDAYMATDRLLSEAGIFPLADGESMDGGTSAAKLKNGSD